MTGSRKLLCFLAALLVACASPAPCQEAIRHEVKGHATTVWAFTNGGPANDGLTLNTNRLRLESELSYRQRLRLHLTGDLEALTGNMIASGALWESLRDDQAGSYWDLTTGGAAGSALYLQGSLYRAWLEYEAKGLKITAGKQRIAWGVMRFLRPTDFFNPESPLQIEPGQRTGLDAVRVAAPLSGKADVEMVAAPSRVPGGDSAAAKCHFISGSYDLAVLCGRVSGSEAAGLTVDGYVGEGGLRGEVVRIVPQGSAPYWQWSVGGDYTFPGSITVTAEFFHNGGASGVPVNPFVPSRGMLVTRNPDFMQLGVSRQVSPLVTLGAFCSYDLKGASVAAGPRVTWNVRENMDFDVGFTASVGGRGGEYSETPHVIFTQAKVYF